MKKVFKPMLMFLGLMMAFAVQAHDYVVPRLSPLPTNVGQSKVNLNGVWKFSVAPQANFLTNPNTSGWSDIEVPGEWVMQGFKVEKNKPAGYVRTFNVPSSWDGQRIKLRCNGVYSDALIYINGKKVGSHLGGFTAFELDVTDFVKVGAQNEIALSVTSESLADSASSASQYAVHPLGGITRDIYLFALPEVNFSMFHVTTDLDDKFVDATLKTEVEVTNESLSDNKNLALNFTLKDANGKVIPLKNSKQTIKPIKKGGKLFTKADFEVAKPEQWTSEHPYLYTLNVELLDGNNVLSTASRRVGFREVEVRGNQMFVNNKPVKLRGINHHEVMPLRGRSLTGDIWAEDVRIFREGNVNYFRTSHYPPDEALLEACDELGMFVEVEAPFCWAHNTTIEDKDHYPVLVNQHVEMVNRDRSHPSVIMWSLGNESFKYKEYFKKAGEIIHEIDPSRPRIFSQWGPEADDGELEVTNHHYPGPGGPDKYRNSKRPVTFDEFVHVNSYNRFELAADPNNRSMWGVLLDRMWSDMYYSQGVLGGAIWAGIDDTFFIPNGGAVGYGTWGPIDGWRRHKPEFWGMKKAYSPARVEQLGNISEEGVVSFEVENRHNFTNLSDCKFVWTYGDKSGVVAVAAEPRERAKFEVNLADLPKNETSLSLSISSPLGFVIDEYNFSILPETQNIASVKPAKKQRLSVKDESDAVRVKQGDKTITLDKRNGLMEVTNKAGDVVMKQSPTLMVLSLNSEGRGIQMLGNDMSFEPYNPVCSNWVSKSITYETTKEAFIATVKGEYKEAEGSFTYTIANDGTIKVFYDFTMKQAVNPRQVGVVFDLADSFTTLAWEREGYWSVYPEDHIGALKGEAIAYDPNTPESGSAGPDKQPKAGWSFDQNKAGTNMFRSTKENVTFAKLTSATLGEVEVDADGTQHVRAWIDPEAKSIKMLVADYTNAGREGFLASHAEKDYRPLKRGDKISGTATLIIK